MKQLDASVEDMFAVFDAVGHALRPDENAFAHLTRSARRDLTIDPEAGGQLRVRTGGFDGYVRLTRGRRTVYLNAPDLTARAAGRLLEAGRDALPLGVGVQATGADFYEGGWRNREGTIDLAAHAADPGPLLGAVTEGAGPGWRVRSLTISETLTEQAFADSAGPRGHSTCHGGEIRAVVSPDDGTGPAVSLARWATDPASVDGVALGRELALLAAASGTPGHRHPGGSIDFLPSAAAQLLRALVGALLVNPVSEPRPLGTAVLDDARAPLGDRARAFDGEGTPTAPMELVTAEGRQNTLATRHNAVLGTDDRHPRRSTGHASWEAHRYQPQPLATQVWLAPAGAAPDPAAGESHVVADVRSLGVEEFRSGGHVALRLLAVRCVDGRPAGACEPFVVQGEAADILAALTAVGETVSFHPGPFSVGGAAVTLDLSRLSPGDSDLSGARPEHD